MRFELTHGTLGAAVESHGGELVSLRDGSNTEYIWGGDPAFWSGRNPHLFPFVGNLKNGSVTFKGQSYQMGRHGFARLDTIILEHLRSTGVSLLHKESGRGLRMDFPGFPMLAFWTKGDKEAPFICLEPWHGCAAVDNESGLFEDKPHCIVLQPGTVKELTYTVTLKSSF